MTSIGERAFEGLRGLTSIVIPNSVTTIGNCAFVSCSSLSNVTIGNSVTTIGDGAFANCSSLSNVTIGNSVTSIGDDAFQSCNGLTDVTIPNSVTSIGRYAFVGANLNAIHISDMVAWCGISFGERWAGHDYDDNGFTLYVNGEKVTNLLIPKEATVVDKLAFYKCNIETITVENGNTVYDSRNGCNGIIESASNTLLKGCKNTTIPNDVTAIADYAFHSIDDMTNITIPNSVITIGDYCFSYCINLNSVTIGKNVTSIGYDAFRQSKLRNVFIKSTTPPALGADSFSNQTLYHTTLYVPTGSWDAYAYDNRWYKFINIRETATAEEQVSMQQAYTLMDASTFAYSVYDPVNNCIGTLSVNGIDENNPNHSWQVIEAEGNRYLYNMGAKKFVVASANGSYTLSDEPTSINMADGDNGIILGTQTAKQWALVNNEHLSVNQAVIDGISLTPALSEGEGEWYDLSGRQVNSLPSGRSGGGRLNIIRYSDGTSKKVLVK